ncbi:MAG TPA: alanine--tRNA ligase [Candidatus Pacebacteria bacterium]|nr:MAG: alanyl-tRNA synthetase [Microgenomates group bacterium GW2011_GWB1_45_17]KKU23355.1 MAG: alanyl-tRNA synthetase [Microgenomates group bacterium GW2011_GWA1_46_15]KKU24516.1 MAG: alanyl-tRNA synthetase [Microgenomates group bacterium GW2011_GWC1_46_15]HAV15113.1 alanine--tRNA ligase [Candidatus Paceibacterota bacterium]HCR11060.1 alanine--tRNA ligase [Candidatus Paceibacterota bacterium]
MTPNDLRTQYIAFFFVRGHAELPSAPLVPENDPTTLFTGFGMQPLVPYLLGQPHPEGKRLVNSQKSFRSGDIEEVGDNRHTTFFEMLGNWSLGDYFKKEQLQWCFEFLTQTLELDPKKLFVTVFRGNDAVPRDTESVKIWKTLFSDVGMQAQDVDFSERDGMQNGRIFYYDEKKNWWSRSGVPSAMPTGEPGGPDSEVFYDFGAELGLHESSPYKNQPCHVNCDCGRFLEIGNSVFMQYQKQADGSFTELPQKNVDFGGGLERILAAVHDEPDIFKTEFFSDLRNKLLDGINKVIIDQTNPEYTKLTNTRESRVRIFLDHSRAVIFLMGEGIKPGKNEREYVVRRLIRRADDQLSILKLDHELYWKEAISHYKKVYKNVYSASWDQENILGIIINELRIYGTVFKNVEKIKIELIKLKEKFSPISLASTYAGPVLFHYQSTYGIPSTATLPLIEEVGLLPKYAFTSFNKEKAYHQEKSRTASKGMFKGGLADHSENVTKYHTATHLLHAALRKVLGEHVSQQGSNITGERLRFDFSHPTALTEEQKKKVEDMINEKIKEDLPVTQEMVSKDEALKQGAMAFFKEKYADTVSMYTIGKDLKKGWFSKELCGGPHVAHTGEIGPIKITKEESVGSGIRRIYVQFA